MNEFQLDKKRHVNTVFGKPRFGLDKAFLNNVIIGLITTQISNYLLHRQLFIINKI
jgi:hypothetical protein